MNTRYMCIVLPKILSVGKITESLKGRG